MRQLPDTRASIPHDANNLTVTREHTQQSRENYTTQQTSSYCARTSAFLGGPKQFQITSLFVFAQPCAAKGAVGARWASFNLSKTRARTKTKRTLQRTGTDRTTLCSLLCGCAPCSISLLLLAAHVTPQCCPFLPCQREDKQR